MEETDIILIKLGGSVITKKDEPLTPNLDAIKGIVNQLKTLNKKMIVIHGGGSFGHYWSVKYDMHTKPQPYDSRGISVVHESMIALNQIITNFFIKGKLNVYSFPPMIFMKNGRLQNDKVNEIIEMTNHNLTPITFGDVIHFKSNNYSILSGDAIMSLLAKKIRPKKIIFAVNVDGLYKNLREKKIIREIKNQDVSVIDSLDNKEKDVDVTGGMRRKVKEALLISSYGLDVMMVNGLKPIHIKRAILGQDFKGTVFRGI